MKLHSIISLHHQLTLPFLLPHSLLPGRPYIFLVRSVNRIGPGPWSEPLEVVSGAGPPDTPHPPHLACRSPHSVHLIWEEPINNGAGIEQYNIQIAEVRMGAQLEMVAALLGS